MTATDVSRRRADQARALLILHHDILSDDPTCARVLDALDVVNQWERMTMAARHDVISALVCQDQLAFAAGRGSV